MGLKGSLRNVSTGVDPIPDSVVTQYAAESFATPWPDEIGSASMTVDGLTASTFSDGSDSVFGDGVDDFGLAPIGSFPARETWGFAFTIQTTDINRLASIQVNGARDIWTHETSDGAYEFFHRSDATGDIIVKSTDSIEDGNVHAVVINKQGESSEDISIYVDDMTTDQASVVSSASVNSSNWGGGGEDIGMYARNTGDSISSFSQMDAGVFEFNTEPYSQVERTAFVDRRPEV